MQEVWNPSRMGEELEGGGEGAHKVGCDPLGPPTLIGSPPAWPPPFPPLPPIFVLWPFLVLRLTTTRVGLANRRE